MNVIMYNLHAFYSNCIKSPAGAGGFFCLIHTPDIKKVNVGVLLSVHIPVRWRNNPIRKLIKWLKFQLTKCSKLVYISVTRPATGILR